MKIDSFERNAEDKVVAICGSVKHVLSWDFVASMKPQVGDVLGVFEEGFSLVKQEAENAVQAIESVFETPAEPITETIPEPIVEAPVEVPVEQPVEITIIP
jgi:hypothetical protein